MKLVVGAAPARSAGAAAGAAETGNELGGALGIALFGALGAVVYRGHAHCHDRSGAGGTRRLRLWSPGVLTLRRERVV
jgi:DHA2 family multidrug resistance protein-like MFS transporter